MVRFFGTLLLLALPLPSLAADYLLGAGDRLRLRAVIWEETTRSFVSWDVVDGEYAVQADGTLSIPIVGSVEADGRNVAAVSESISAQLQVQGGMANVPAIALEVLTYRPFYILGDIRGPGAYPAQPGLTAQQALALAGGLGNALDDRPLNLIREVGTLREIRGEITRAQMREARLEAEIADTEALTVPPELSHPDGPQALARIEAQEQAIFDARRAEIARELGALNDLEALLLNEVAGLESKLEGQRAQLDLARETLENVESLVARGLAPANRLADTQRSLITLESTETDILNALYRARQRISENQRDIVALQAGRETGATIELQQTTAELETLAVRRAVVEELILTEGGAGVFDEAETRTSYLLRRSNPTPDGATNVVEIGPDDRIGPGDVLLVSVEIVDTPAPSAN
ncbi:hypothetical protein OCH239_12980 [Roseivivax halodurans JCM 10272]|uniref:Soluble ligand binding domain-containing protein n=1 Tax=Roseivivax halodurans JCM 10272 TaxID=1449350 RepID=X7EDG9_9RHOB|nr:polysaccharide biosynthesis/export family protein [Roseivivax halodurans]ETX13178.1 hypothetical protein OCH239_12980 [Roseivivax halodurans JCM 10272]